MWNFKKFFFFLIYSFFFFFNITTHFSSFILIPVKYLDPKVLKFIVSEILMNACMHEAVEMDGAWTVNQQWGQTRGRI